jgi:hypothetical protein
MAVVLPYIMSVANLAFPSKWATVTHYVVQITFGSWVGTALTSAVQGVIWLCASLSIIDAAQNDQYKKETKTVRNFTIWLLGILTVLAAYLTAWSG